LDVPPPVVTVTSIVPPFDGPAGEVAVQEVVEEQETDVAAVVPNKTVVPPEAVEKLVPDMATDVPPATGP
jgi:hypothetical protein